MASVTAAAPPLPSIDSLIEKARQTNATMLALEQELQQRRWAIFNRAHAAGRSTNAAEDKEIQSIENKIADIDTAVDSLAFSIYLSIDRSQKVAELKKRMDQVNDDLKDTLDELKKIQAYAATAAQLLDLITQIGTALVALGA